jgi:hypothetical protein
MTLDGSLISYASNINLLRQLELLVEPGMKTLETGAGWSTVIFAGKGAEHTCIMPSEEQKKRIILYCRENGISIDRVTFVVEKSEDALPKMKEKDFMLYLIDGRHAFPYPMIDFLRREAYAR